ncbi:MAG: haloacid dehalogenase, partial [Candidatus Angelobacter sp.]
MGLESVCLITFDCYGTLIDWEAGLLKGLRPLFAAASRVISDAELLELYGDIEAELEASPYLPYRDVMARTAQSMGQRLGATISADAGRAFAESLAEWEPFPDTVAALQSLSRMFTLGIISNVDD